MDRFRGGFPATIDAKGRVKLPARLREQLEASFGREVYICSFFPHELRIYPLPVWQGVEERLLSKPTLKPAVRKLIERVNYGQLQELDDHGRLWCRLCSEKWSRSRVKSWSRDESTTWRSPTGRALRRS